MSVQSIFLVGETEITIVHRETTNIESGQGVFVARNCRVNLLTTLMFVEPDGTNCSIRLYWEHFGNRGIRQGKWKLVATARGEWELYDLEADRTELNDLSDKRPDKAKVLNDLYDAWAVRCGVIAEN